MSAVLELKKNLGLKYDFNDRIEIHKLILDGIQKSVVKIISDVTGLETSEIVDILPISSKQFGRYKSTQLLSIELSEHIIAIGEIALVQYKVFKSKDLFREWLFEPNVVLDGDAPYNLMKTIPGCKLIKDLINRVAHGVYS